MLGAVNIAAERGEVSMKTELPASNPAPHEQYRVGQAPSLAVDRDRPAMANSTGAPGHSIASSPIIGIAENNALWTFAWKNLITRPTRTVLAILGLTIPVLAFLGLFSLSGGIRHLMGDTLARMQNLIVLSQNATVPVLSDLPPEVGDALRRVPGVRVAAAEVWKAAPPIDGRGGNLGAAAFGMLTKSKAHAMEGLLNMVAVQGQDLREHARLKSATIAHSILPASQGGGRMLNASDAGRPNVVISTKIAHDYPNADGTPKRVGQTIRLGTHEYAIVGLYNTGSLLIDATIAMDIGTARRLFGLRSDAVSVYNVEPQDAADSDALADRIERTVSGVRAQRISQFDVTVAAVMGRLDLFLLLAVALAMLVGGVGIANTMLMSTSERYIEFGVMRTNGWTRRNVLLLVTAESAILGGLSGSLGSALATAGVFALNQFLEGFALDLRPGLVAASVATALAIATLSGLYPAWKASRMTPMDAIRHSVT
jgi:putative ABC transport system permease protein